MCVCALVHTPTRKKGKLLLILWNFVCGLYFFDVPHFHFICLQFKLIWCWCCLLSVVYDILCRCWLPHSCYSRKFFQTKLKECVHTNAIQADRCVISHHKAIAHLSAVLHGLQLSSQRTNTKNRQEIIQSTKRREEKKSVSNNIAFIHSCVCTRDSLYGAVIYVRLCTNMLWLANRSVEKVCFLATCECLRVFAVWFGSFCDSQHNLNSQESAFGQKALFY